MDEKTPPQVKKQPISLSNFTKALLNNFKLIKKKQLVADLSKVTVSQTVSFFAIVYERVRNAVEYREEHLIRRASIERILKRRLAMNPNGTGEAENVIRELLWARYFPNGSLGNADLDIVQKLIDRYVQLRNSLLIGQADERRAFYGQFLFDLLTCEIEESLSPEDAKKSALFTSFIYQVLRNKIKVDGLSAEDKDAVFYVACEKSFAKSDRAYLRYHLFTLSNKPLLSMSLEEMTKLTTELPSVLEKIERVLKNPQADRLTRYVKSQMPPFAILFDIFKNHPSDIDSLISDRDKLWQEVDKVCRLKYQQTGLRLRNVAIKSLIYIFLTKMVFALILEYPLSLYLYGEVNNTSIAINSLFPPVLMLLIISFVKIPGEENTRRVFERMVDVINADKSFESNVAVVLRKARVRRPVLIFGFTVFYTMTFAVTLGLIYGALRFFNFNGVSMLIFIFFVSVVSFFGYRVRQIAKEFRLQTRESFFSPFADFFFMPILSLGKFFSQEIAKLNFFIVILDFLIEAPFKLVFEVVEEWISFVRARKEEII